MQKVIIYDPNVEQNKTFCEYLAKDKTNEIYIYGEYEELTIQELNLFFAKLKIPLNSNGSYYLREAIFECYYHPNSPKNLNDIVSIIAKKYNKTGVSIRSGIRGALRRLNMYKEHIDCPIMKYFDCNQNITPKEFLEIAVMYLQYQKRITIHK